MPYNNPYIEKVANHDHIWSDETQMHSMKGKWREYFQENQRAKIKEQKEGSFIQPKIKNQKSKTKLMLEIGTGMGNFFCNYAASNPETACVGIELKFKRLYRTYEKSALKGRDDVILLKVFGQEITKIFAPEEVDELYLLFSDPWPKKGHHKNRVIQDDFLRDAASILAPDGSFLIKTDESSYAIWIEEHLERSPYFTFTKTSNEDPDKRPSPENSTEFETMGRREGSEIVSFLCRKK